VIKVEAPIVDAVQAALKPVVLSADTGQKSAFGCTHRHEEGVHAVVDAVGDELGKDHGRLAVNGGVAEVVLPRPAERCIDHELLGFRVVLGRGGDSSHIGAVSRFGHRVDAGKLE